MVKRAVTAPAGELKGPAQVDDKLPTAKELKKAGEIDVYDREGKAHPLSSLYTSKDDTKHTTLVVFIRHFYCGVSLLPTHFPPHSLITFSAMSRIYPPALRRTPALLYPTFNLRRHSRLRHLLPYPRLHTRLQLRLPHLRRSNPPSLSHPPYDQHPSHGRASALLHGQNKL